MDLAETGRVLRQKASQRLNEAHSMATAGEIERAAMFLEFAREVRVGKRNQRNGRRSTQAAWAGAGRARA